MSPASRIVYCCLWLLSFAFNAKIALATTIVEIRTPDEVVIAADSAGTFRGGGRTTVGSVCKIYQVGKSFFSVGGLVGDPGAGFSVPQIVAHELRDDRSVADSLKAIEDGLRSALPSELSGLTRRDPEAGKYEPLVITVLIARLQSHTPVGAAMHLSLAMISPLGTLPDPEVKICPSSTCSTTIWWSVPTASVIPSRLEHGREALSLASPSNVARNLVQLDIDADTPGVGGPIDVLRLLPTGIIFPQMKPQCPTVTQP
jgi:hypothetical protein